MCAEKVESAASIDCASPISARNALKTGKLAPGGHRQSGLRHHCQQCCRLQRHRFAAGIGTADDHLPLGRGQLQSQRDNPPAVGSQALFQQRMARAFKAQNDRAQIAGGTQS